MTVHPGSVDSDGVPGFFKDNAAGLVDSGRYTWASLADEIERSTPGVPEVAWLRAQDQPAPAAEPVVTVSPDAVPAAAEAPQA